MAFLQGFNAQLQRTATQLAALGQVAAVDEQDWELEDRAMRWAGAGGCTLVARHRPGGGAGMGEEAVHMCLAGLGAGGRGTFIG